MTAGDEVVPQAVQATSAEGAAAIDLIVARRRSVLARLSLAARTAAQRCDQAERALAAQPEVGTDGVPADLLGVVDVMLEKAVSASDHALEAARGEAAFIVAGAITESVELLRRAGLDPSVLPPVRRPAATAHRVGPPPSAAELWRGVRPESAPTRMAVPSPWSGPGSAAPPASAPSVPSPPSAAPADGRAAEPSASFFTVAPSPTGEPAVDRTAVAVAATLLLDGPPARLDDDHADPFDDFWQAVPAERRVRDRILRRSPKESA